MLQENSHTPSPEKPREPQTRAETEPEIFAGLGMPEVPAETASPAEAEPAKDPAPTPNDATFSNTLCGHYLGRTRLALGELFSKLPFSGARYTGYHGEMWTPETFDRVTQSEGLYCKALLNYSERHSISPAAALEKLSYLREAPSAVITALAINHSWEEFTGSSPFVATSASIRIASVHGPYYRTLHGDIFGSRRSPAPSVIFESKGNDEIRLSTQLGNYSKVRADLRELFDATCLTSEALESSLDYYRKSGDKEGIERYEAVARTREWLANHKYLDEILDGSSFARRHDSDPLAYDQQSARGGFADLVRRASMNWDWQASEILKMARREAEYVALLQLPGDNIRSATLYDEGKRVIRRFARD